MFLQWQLDWNASHFHTHSKNSCQSPLSLIIHHMINFASLNLLLHGSYPSLPWIQLKWLGKGRTQLYKLSSPRVGRTVLLILWHKASTVQQVKCPSKALSGNPLALLGVGPSSLEGMVLGGNHDLLRNAWPCVLFRIPTCSHDVNGI